MFHGFRWLSVHFQAVLLLLVALTQGEGLLDPLIFQHVDVLARRLLPAFCETLDSYRAFTVLYEAERDGDKELAMHYDNAEVTLNVNIGGPLGSKGMAFQAIASFFSWFCLVKIFTRGAWA